MTNYKVWDKESEFIAWIQEVQLLKGNSMYDSIILKTDSY
jgi:hypothetical protein